jgi:hypothetical protein
VKSKYSDHQKKDVKSKHSDHQKKDGDGKKGQKNRHGKKRA